MSLILQTFKSAQTFLQAIGAVSTSDERTTTAQSDSIDNPYINIMIGAAHDVIAAGDLDGKSIWMIFRENDSKGEAETTTKAYGGNESIK
jgi:hypothetical protein